MKWQRTSAETASKAHATFTALMTIADSPIEAAEILTAVYVALWLTHGAEGASIDDNLQGLCDCIKMNVEMASAERGSLQ